MFFDLCQLIRILLPQIGFISASYATGDAEGGGDGRKDWDHQLNNRFPSFFFFCSFNFVFLIYTTISSVYVISWRDCRWDNRGAEHILGIGDAPEVDVPRRVCPRLDFSIVSAVVEECFISYRKSYIPLDTPFCVT